MSDFNIDDFSFSDDLMDSFGIGEPAAGPAEERKEPRDLGQPGSTVEEDAKAEVNEVLDGFKQRAQREDQRFWDAVDSEFWVAFCFQTREQKEEFLTKLKLMDLGDKYLDGMEAARVMGVTLESRVPINSEPRSFDREFLNIAMDLPDNLEDL